MGKVLWVHNGYPAVHNGYPGLTEVGARDTFVSKKVSIFYATRI